MVAEFSRLCVCRVCGGDVSPFWASHAVMLGDVVRVWFSCGWCGVDGWVGFGRDVFDVLCGIWDFEASGDVGLVEEFRRELEFVEEVVGSWR